MGKIVVGKFFEDLSRKISELQALDADREVGSELLVDSAMTLIIGGFDTSAI